MYDPAIGRFISADPVIPGIERTQSFNRYSYVWNNPLSFTDPSGFSPDGLYDFDSPDGGRRRDCDEFCRAWDSMLNEFLASTRENRREWPSYLFLEPKAGDPYEMDLCSMGLCPTPGINPIPGITSGFPWPSDRSRPYTFTPKNIEGGRYEGNWHVLKPATGYKVTWWGTEPRHGVDLPESERNASSAFHDFYIEPNDNPREAGEAYSISEDGRIVNGDLSSGVFVAEPILEIPTAEDILRDMPPPSLPELDQPFRDD